MTTGAKQKLAQAIGCVLCMAISWKLTWRLDGTEFSGGHVTGPLLNMADTGFFLLAISLILLSWLPRIAGATGLAASLLCLPLCLLFIAPGPFRHLVGGEWSAPLQSNFYWSRWTVGWTIALLATILVCLRNAAQSAPESPQQG
jgi:hypothetical protein